MSTQLSLLRWRSGHPTLEIWREGGNDHKWSIVNKKSNTATTTTTTPTNVTTLSGPPHKPSTSTPTHSTATKVIAKSPAPSLQNQHTFHPPFLQRTGSISKPSLHLWYNYGNAANLKINVHDKNWNPTHTDYTRTPKRAKTISISPHSYPFSCVAAFVRRWVWSLGIMLCTVINTNPHFKSKPFRVLQKGGGCL